ncbi:PLDc N-terminal domain-containing protein [Mucilaginibacter terrae]|uniref:Cardiolipin synthase N-terminal domain-containing protein n=1 Tax=Mucilaginibacter terrae TaxID=1955052 RepID=A0ABU3GUC2_9SPHI|nr:PLDc N-terminal domain-containing protein [Mucilaginibacter terrae]MDT3403381.1 hypothetical protein [Mucilaginibacter terrae]
MAPALINIGSTEITILLAFILLVTVAAISKVAKNEKMPVNTKFIWIVVIVLLPILGPLLCLLLADRLNTPDKQI